jgi:hypothetical protein
MDGSKKGGGTLAAVPRPRQHDRKFSWRSGHGQGKDEGQGASQEDRRAPERSAPIARQGERAESAPPA